MAADSPLFDSMGNYRLTNLTLRTGLNKYLKVLIELDIIQKIEPVMNDSKKKVIYHITDPFFRFWYRYVPANLMAIAAGRMDRVYCTIVCCQRYQQLHGTNLQNDVPLVAD